MVVHPQVVTDAHNAGCAAAKQGKFVAFKDAFWEKAYLPYQAAHDPSKLGRDNIMAIAKDIGLDPAKFTADMDGADCKAHVQADMAELAKFKVGSTPTFYINGKLVLGAVPKEQFKQTIDEKLKIAEASGVSGGSYYDKEIMGKGLKQFRSKMDAGK
jgi:predicted DsbA family dithiol-disulfide isomerase